MPSSHIPLRTNRIINFFLVCFLLILIRAWFLSVIQYDENFEKSLKPKRRTVIERFERATIRDRFNLPLAINTMQYNAAICYADIRQIPSFRWETDEKGKRKRVRARTAYIEKFSAYLAEVLDMDPQEVEDTIHGKACLFPHTPFVLKENISEELYYRLKMAEKDWLGMQMQQMAKRVYPQGKVACDILGYMGAIDQREYLNIAQEIQCLKTYLSEHSQGQPSMLPKGFNSLEEVQVRLQDLQERSYTINDQIGKSGVEASFDEVLRGTYGKKIFAVDIKGNPVQLLPESTSAVSGERLILSISSELQLEAEKLLSEYEALQDRRDTSTNKERRHPWQRGGAIVALHPKTGEVLALASYPRYDPNDLIPAQSREKRLEKRPLITKWLESESYVGDIWDGKQNLSRELFSSEKNAFYTEEHPLLWESYLDTILPKAAPIRLSIDRVDSVAKAIHLQKYLEELLVLSPYNSVPDLIQNLYHENAPLSSDKATLLKEELDPFLDPISYKNDQLLFLDLVRMVIKETAFSPSLLSRLEEQTLSEFRTFCQGIARYNTRIKSLARHHFERKEFANWRKAHFKNFLREKRREEKKKRRYARPYTEYLEKQKEEMFAAFWAENRYQLLYAFVMEESKEDPLIDEIKEFLSPLQKSDALTYLQSLRSFHELDRPLLGKYRALRSRDGIQYEKHLAAGFYPYSGFGHGRSQAFRQATPMGSIFKIIPAYAALNQQEKEQASILNPLTLTDSIQWVARAGSNKQVLGYFDNGDPIKRFYHGGRLPRTSHKIGKIDIVGALERSSNIYFSILSGEILKSPTTLIDAASSFGLGRKTGIDLPGEYQGLLPTDIMHNKTGLYSFAIGQHSLVATPLQASIVLSAIANQGHILKPQIVKLSAGKTSNLQGYLHFREPEVQSTLPLSEEVQVILLQGMHQVTNSSHGTARLNLIRSQFHTSGAMKSYRKMRRFLVGKTGTAEINYKQTLDAESKANLEKHVWFGGICYKDEEHTEPELIVIVNFRFGTAGKQGAPLVSRLFEKWKEIQSLH